MGVASSFIHYGKSLADEDDIQCNKVANCITTNRSR